MKRIVIILLSVIMLFISSSCSKSEEEGSNTNYTIVYTGYPMSQDGAVFTIYECNSAGADVFVKKDNFHRDDQKTYTAVKDAANIKIHILIDGALGVRKGWVQTIYPLNIGGHTTIEIEDDVILGNMKP